MTRATQTQRRLVSGAPAGDVRVHVLQTGRLVGNRTFLRGEGWSSLLRRPVAHEFPAQCFVVEHPEGLIAIDTGIDASVRVARPQRRLVPVPIAGPGDELGPQMRARGLDPAAIRRVILTHLDWDHAGGLRHVPGAEVLVHRPEWAFAHRFLGRRRCRPELWPADLRPLLVDLEPEPLGPFPASRAVTDRGDVILVALPGHTPGQVGVVVRTGGPDLLFAGDHMLRQDWFLEDHAAGRLVQLGVFSRAAAVETSRRIHRRLAEVPTVLVPSHDPDARARLAAREPACVG